MLDCLPRIFGCLRCADIHSFSRTKLWKEALAHHTHLAIDASADDRCFWDRIPLSAASRIGECMRELQSITVGYPCGCPRWCLDVLVSLVEAHGKGQQEWLYKEGSGRKRRKDDVRGTLRSITFKMMRLSGEGVEALKRTASELPPVPATATMLDALTSIKGLASRMGEEFSARHWELPLLSEIRAQRGGDFDFDPAVLAGFAKTSTSLRVIDAPLDFVEWVAALAAMPKTSAPLANLQVLRTLALHALEGPPDNDAIGTGLDSLQKTLLSRGGDGGFLRAIEFTFVDEIDADCLGVVDGRIFTALSHLESFVKAVGKSRDISVTFTGRVGAVDVALLHSVPTNPPQSPFVIKQLLHLASLASDVVVTITPEDVSTPPTNLSEAAKEIASLLVFKTAMNINVKDADGWDPPDEWPPPGHVAPTVQHLPHDAFPMAEYICIQGGKVGGVIAGRQLAKRARMADISILGHAISGQLPEGEVMRILQSIGSGVRLEKLRVYVSIVNGVSLNWGGKVPRAREMEIFASGVHEMSPLNAICGRIAALLNHGGLDVIKVEFTELNHTTRAALFASMRKHMQDGDTIEGHDGAVFDVDLFAKDQTASQELFGVTLAEVRAKAFGSCQRVIITAERRFESSWAWGIAKRGKHRPWGE